MDGCPSSSENWSHSRFKHYRAWCANGGDSDHLGKGKITCSRVHGDANGGPR